MRVYVIISVYFSSGVHNVRAYKLLVISMVQHLWSEFRDNFSPSTLLTSITLSPTCEVIATSASRVESVLFLSCCTCYREFNIFLHRCCIFIIHSYVVTAE